MPLLVALVSALGAWPVLATPGAQETFEVAERGFRVEVPAGWARRETSEGAIWALVLQPEDGDGSLSLTVRVVASAAIGGLDGALASVRAAVDAAPEQYGDLRESRRLMAGARARGFRFEARPAPGTTLEVAQALREERGRVFVLQTVRPQGAGAGRGDARARALRRGELQRAWDSFVLLEPTPAEAELERLRALAARCGSELDWAETWAEAERRARAERRLVLVVARMTVGFAISDGLMSGPFMDPDVVELVRAHYVPLELGRGMDVPFADPALYGMGPSTFGTCLMLVTPDGEVVGESVVTVLPFLRAGLSAHPEWSRATTDLIEDPVERGRRLRLHGELVAAWDVLTEHRTARAHLELARLYRERGEDGAAGGELTEAEYAAKRDGELELVGDAVLERALGARSPRGLREMLGEHPDHPRVPEARWWLGQLLFAEGSRDEAARTWRALVDERPESRWAWRAAASLTSTAFELDRRPRLGGPPREALDLPLRPSFEPLPAAEAPRAERDAARWLLREQRADGTWFTPSEASRAPDEPDDLGLAATALAARGLLIRLGSAGDGAAASDARGSSDSVGRASAGSDGESESEVGDEPREQRGAEGGVGEDVGSRRARAAERRERAAERRGSRRAVEHALDALLAEHARVRALPPRRVFMDYGSWSRPCLLWLVADALAAGVGERARLLAVAPVLVAEIAERQKPGGGWNDYVTSDVTTGGAAASSNSSNTALALLALMRAREVGIEVSAELVERGLDALAAMRNPNGTFEYSLEPDRVESPRATRRPGAAGRGPGCVLALVRGGRAGTPELRESLEILVAHGDELAREGGKTLMHAGADAQGSHYLMLDWATAALAVAALPADERAPFRAEVLRLCLGSRTKSGAFFDNPLVGRAAGTGLALVALHALED